MQYATMHPVSHHARTDARRARFSGCGGRARCGRLRGVNDTSTLCITPTKVNMKDLIMNSGSKRPHRPSLVIFLLVVSLLLATFLRDYLRVSLPRSFSNILEVPSISDFFTAGMEVKNGKYKYCNYPWEPMWLECCFFGGGAEAECLLSRISESARTWEIEGDEIMNFCFAKFADPVDIKGFAIIEEHNPRTLVLVSGTDMNGRPIVALCLQ